MKTIPLHEITAELLAIEDALIEGGGEITPELEADFLAVEAMEAEKVAGYVAIIRRLETTATGIKEEVDRLRNYQRVMQTGADNLKGRLLHHMQVTGRGEYQTRLGRVKVMNSGGKPPVFVKYHAEDLPERFRRVTVEPDKSALLEALQAGDPEAAEYAEIGERSQYLRIF